MGYIKKPKQPLKHLLKILLLIGLTTLCGEVVMAQHWIIFLAYPDRKDAPGYEDSKAGHVYVSFVSRNETNKQTVIDEIWGFHPAKDGSPQAFFYIEGKMRNDTEFNNGKPQSENVLAADYDFVVEVNDEIYQRCKNVKKIWEKKFYSVIAGQTCVQYARDVAAQIPNVIIPTTPVLDRIPKDFLLDLRKKNSNLDTDARISLSSPPDGAAMKKYSSPDGLFQFSYPGDWKQAPQSSDYRFKAQFYNQFNGDKAASMFVFIEPASSTTSTNNLKANIQNEVLSGNNTKVIKLESKNYGKFPGVFVEYTESSMPSNLHILRWTIIKDGQLVTIFYQTGTNTLEFEGLSIINSFALNEQKAEPVNIEIDKEAVKTAALNFYSWHDSQWQTFALANKLESFSLILNKSGKPETEDGYGCPCTIDWKAANNLLNWLKQTAPVSNWYIRLSESNLQNAAQLMNKAKNTQDNLTAVENVFTSGAYHFFEGNAGPVKFSQSGIFDKNAIWDITSSPSGTVYATATFAAPPGWAKKIMAYRMELIKEKGVYRIAAPVTEGVINPTFTTKTDVNTDNLTGGATPEELGKILLKALQTNNKKLWLSCIHPETEAQEQMAGLFDRFRKELIEAGLSNWNLIRFSRVTYSSDEFMGQSAPAVMGGEKVAREVVVEFYYNNKEFLGGFGFTVARTYKKKNYFMFRSMYTQAQLVRYIK